MAGWAAAAQVAGEVAGAWISSDSQHKANRMNLRLQREQQAWEEKMSNTALQRRMADAQGAGINPLYAIGTGVASTPSIAPAHMESEGAKAGEILSGTAARAVATKQAIELNRAQVYATTAAGAKSLAETRLTNEQAGLVAAQKLGTTQSADESRTRVVQMNQAMDKMQLEMEGLVSENTIKRIDAQIREHTKGEIEAAIRADTLGKLLGIPSKEYESKKSEIKGAVLRYLDKLTNPDLDTGTFHDIHGMTGKWYINPDKEKGK